MNSTFLSSKDLHIQDGYLSQQDWHQDRASQDLQNKPQNKPLESSTSQSKVVNNPPHKEVQVDTRGYLDKIPDAPLPPLVAPPSFDRLDSNQQKPLKKPAPAPKPALKVAPTPPKTYRFILQSDEPALGKCMACTCVACSSSNASLATPNSLDSKPKDLKSQNDTSNNNNASNTKDTSNPAIIRDNKITFQDIRDKKTGILTGMNLGIGFYSFNSANLSILPVLPEIGILLGYKWYFAENKGVRGVLNLDFALLSYDMDYLMDIARIYGIDIGLIAGLGLGVNLKYGVFMPFIDLGASFSVSKDQDVNLLFKLPVRTFSIDKSSVYTFNINLSYTYRFSINY